MECENTNVDRLFRSIQRFLETTPLLVWGSGATVPCGMPAIRENYAKFDRFYHERFNKTAKKYTAENFDEVVTDEGINGFLPWLSADAK